VDAGKVLEASGAGGGVDGAQEITAKAMTCSGTSIISLSKEEARPEWPQAKVSFGLGRSRRFSLWLNEWRAPADAPG
jgi:hypothetical protein